jgi:tRNA A37 N6-isopentenylltransferase MiaA
MSTGRLFDNLTGGSFREVRAIARNPEAFHQTQRNGEYQMSRKNKNKRRSAQEVLNSFTRENVLGYITERDSLAANVRMVADTVARMKEANLPEANIEAVRAMMDNGAMMRLSYLEGQVRRAAFAIIRARGYASWAKFVQENAESIPSASDKQIVTLATL